MKHIDDTRSVIRHLHEVESTHIEASREPSHSRANRLRRDSGDLPAPQPPQGHSDLCVVAQLWTILKIEGGL